jgi:hypothetical protein
MKDILKISESVIGAVKTGALKIAPIGKASYRLFSTKLHLRIILIKRCPPNRAALLFHKAPAK